MVMHMDPQFSYVVEGFPILRGCYNNQMDHLLHIVLWDLHRRGMHTYEIHPMRELLSQLEEH
jgi:hypothetical protein